MEEIRIKKIQDRLERQRQLESTLKYKFQSMPKEDQWALIGGGVSIIVLIMLGKDHKTSIIYRLISGIFRIYEPSEWILNLNSSNCRALKIIFNDTELEPVSWELKFKNTLFNFCAGVGVGAQLLFTL